MEIKKIILNKIKRQYSLHPKGVITCAIIIFIILAYLIELTEAPTQLPDQPTAADLAVDTHIPRGQVLVPIEVQNLASLDALIGSYGVVDLYTEGEKESIAQAVKIVRSPKDPQQFAVLVDETQSKNIVQYSHKPFQVIVQNPLANNTRYKKTKQIRRILWE